MTAQFSKCGNYKLENGSLYELEDGKWMHCAKTLKKSVEAAIREYKG